MSVKKYLTKLVNLSICSILFLPFYASGNTDLRINGFLTVGAGKMLDGDINIAGYTDTTTYHRDTKVGLQFTKPVSDKVTFNAQLTGREGTPDYAISATWAFASYQLSDSISVRAGRFRLPFYMYSEFVDVSYAYPWIRPPEAFTLDFSDLDGINLLYNNFIGDINLTLEGYAGRYEVATPTVSVEDLMGGVVKAELGYFTARLSLHNLSLISTNFPVAGLNLDTDSAQFFETGLIYDDFTNFAFIEYTNSTVPDNFFITTPNSNLIATYGYRFGNFMPHISYDMNTNPDTSVLTPGDQKQITTSIIGGLRWDFSPSSALKVQYQTKEIDNDGSKTSGSMISTSVDLVF